MKTFILGAAAVMMAGVMVSVLLYHNLPPRHTPKIPEARVEEPQNTPLEPLQAILVNEKTGYSLQNGELNITYDNGVSWGTVPVEKDLLFAGEYQGNKQELIKNSFVLTEQQTAFLYVDGEDWVNQSVHLVFTEDMGRTWQHATVSEAYSAPRFRKIEFLDENFGYAIVSGGRTMSSEGSDAFLTFDGGKTWEAAANSGTTRLIYDGGFVDEKTGFLSYGTINPQEPDLHVTQDGGETWQKAAVNIPHRYNLVFVSAEVPFKEGTHLAMLVNQGPNGDFQGGNIKGKFVSEDNGRTWEFSRGVEPNE
ncbi:oxidoreductase [Bacillus sp. FJAT-27251]|uniref:sialidase family protein n=1 Tax=Bacillus sp. FJAT-27251 TaxID=1684142 RepID=UPI0006A77018|nr:oxidoreductase [Bacillus sp. FJAT-27251]